MGFLGGDDNCGGGQMWDRGVIHIWSWGSVKFVDWSNIYQSKKTLHWAEGGREKSESGINRKVCQGKQNAVKEESGVSQILEILMCREEETNQRF